MGQKAHPKALRLGIIKNWDCNWFAEDKYAECALEDFKIRGFLKEELKRAGVANIIMNRKADCVEAVIYVARPGIIFGKGTPDTTFLSEALKKQLGRNIAIRVVEEKNVDTNAKLLSEWVAVQLEKRVPFRRAMKMAVQKALKAGVLGIRINCAGRLGGAEIARTEWYREGKVPLHTFRADIDYGFSEALTTFGKIGVKTWVYHGEVLTKKEAERAAVFTA